jgi:DNA polymerase-3 subunit delta
MLYVLYGTERLLMDQRLDKLKKDHHCNQERMNYTVYDVSKEYIPEDKYEEVMRRGKPKIVIKKADFLTTKKIKKDNHDIDYFMQCLPYLDKTVHLVIFNDEKNFDERKKVVKMLRKEAQFYEINPLNYYKVSDTARQAVKKRNCTIDDDALELLLSRKGTNLMDIASEVEKLCLYTQHIDIHCVEELVSRPLDENVFDLTTAILSKDKQKMMSIYKDLMTINEEPVKLIVLVANSMRLIYQVKLLDRKGYTDQEIAKMLAVNPFRLKYVRKEGQFFQIDELLRCLNELSLLDVKIKTGQIDKKLGLELFMLRI